MLSIVFDMNSIQVFTRKSFRSKEDRFVLRVKNHSNHLVLVSWFCMVGYGRMTYSLNHLDVVCYGCDLCLR